MENGLFRPAKLLLVALAASSLMLLASRGALAQGAAPALTTIAILDMANGGMDPRMDYLAGIIQGTLAYDLGGRSELSLVERRNLDAVLREKELSLSALGTDTDAAAAAGKLVGASWLLSGEYIFMGSDILLTLSLTETATAKRLVFRDRGSTDNLVHHLAEQIVQRLTGTAVVFADESKARSLVSLRDETPGSMAIHSPIIDAKIYLDEQFVGYTTGDARKAFELDKVTPGRHRVRIHLAQSFGVVRLPAVEFGDWDVTVQVESSKRLVIQDPTHHFNDVLYHLIKLYSETRKSPSAEPAKLAFTKELGFVDRSGAPVRVFLRASPRPTESGLKLDLDLRVERGAPTVETRASKVVSADAGSLAPITPAAVFRPGPPPPAWDSPATATLALSRSGSEAEGEDRKEATAGILKLEASLSRGHEGWRLEISIDRSDIWQGMYDE